MNKHSPIRILCVDDHPIVREGLAAIIATQSDLQLIGEAEDAESAVEIVREEQPDIVIMDLRLPGMGGVEATRFISQQFPSTRVIVLTTYEGDEDIHRALEAGACAYLLKEMVRKELLQTIRDVHAGQRRIPAIVAERLAERMPRANLSERELEVLKLLGKGLRNKEIGAQLGIAEDTVKIHVKNIFTKLNVIDRTQAVVTASLRGIVRLEDEQ